MWRFSLAQSFLSGGGAAAAAGFDFSMKKFLERDPLAMFLVPSHSHQNGRLQGLFWNFESREVIHTFIRKLYETLNIRLVPVCLCFMFMRGPFGFL